MQLSHGDGDGTGCWSAGRHETSQNISSALQERLKRLLFPWVEWLPWSHCPCCKWLSWEDYPFGAGSFQANPLLATSGLC